MCVFGRYLAATPSIIDFIQNSFNRMPGQMTSVSHAPHVMVRSQEHIPHISRPTLTQLQVLTSTIVDYRMVHFSAPFNQT